MPAPTPAAPRRLSELQALFLAAVSGGNPRAPERLTPWLERSGTLSVSQGIEAYRTSVAGKWLRSLEEIYPVCGRLVGPEFFAALAHRYIRAHPSRSPDLGDYGAHLPEFLTDFEPARALAYLPDVARLEWHWHRVFNGEDPPAFDHRALARVDPQDWPELVFELPRNSVLLRSEFPVHRIWQANQPEASGSGETDTIDLEVGQARLFLWRDGVETRIDLPEEAEWWMLEALAEGEPFGRLCERLAGGTPAVDVGPLAPMGATGLDHRVLPGGPALRPGSIPLDRVQVIIPVLDEEEAIGPVIQALQRQGLERIRVVDNGSDDRSVQVAADHGAEVLLEPRRGYGQACWRGLQGLPVEVEWILFCDGDGSDDLAALGKLLEGAGEADLILGNRRASAEGRACLTPAQNLGNGLAILLIGLGWGHWYGDLGPLRLIRRSALERLALQDRGFGWTVEMQTRALEEGLTVDERPVRYGRRRHGHSKISGTVAGTMAAGLTILSTLAVLFGRRLGRCLDPVRVPLCGMLILAGALLCRTYGPFPRPATGSGFWAGIALLGLGYGLSWPVRRIGLGWFMGVAVGARLVLLGMEPSNDLWRYLWEGGIQNHGFSPYALAPDAAVLEPLRTDWWALINHPSTSAIYPPLAQWGFRLVAAVSPTVIAFKLAFTAADLAVLALLCRRFGRAESLLYAWNPLVLFSFAGEGHLDSWMLLALVVAWGAFDQGRPRRSALWLGVSVALKWITAPIGLFLLWRTPAPRRVGIALALVAPLLISGLSFCSGPGSCRLIPLASTFVSHGRSAELVPWLLEGLLPASRVSNAPFGLALGGLVVLLLLWTTPRFSLFAERYLIGLLLLSPIVHGWYFSWLVPFAVATRNAGTKLVSLSVFVYSVLRPRQELGDPGWLLTNQERLLLWAPFVLGVIWTEWSRWKEGRDT